VNDHLADAVVAREDRDVVSVEKYQLAAYVVPGVVRRTDRTSLPIGGSSRYGLERPGSRGDPYVQPASKAGR
jgi:hypothetical protein